MKNVEISILIASYNKEKYIKRCIDSCLNQNFKKNYEIIFVDDCSKDGSFKVAKNYNKKIKVFKTNKKNNKNLFNTYYQMNTYYKAFKKSKGKIICLLDCDDFYKKNKLSYIFKLFNDNHKLSIIFDNPIFFYNKKKQNPSNINYSIRENKWPKFPSTSCISVRRTFINKYKKEIFIKKFSMLTVDFRLAARSNENNSIFLKKSLTYYFQDFSGESYKKFKTLSQNWWSRRKQAFEYLNLINNKKLLSFDYIITKFIMSFINNEKSL